jgi:hypothetical protein
LVGIVIAMLGMDLRLINYLHCDTFDALGYLLFKKKARGTIVVRSAISWVNSVWLRISTVCAWFGHSPSGDYTTLP